MTTPNTTKEVEEIVEYVMRMTVSNQFIYDTMNMEQKALFTNDIRMAVEEALSLLTAKHEAEKQEIYESLDANYHIIIELEKEKAVDATYEHILTELHSYNNRSDCDPEWHDGFSEAIDKVEELLTPTKTDKQDDWNEDVERSNALFETDKTTDV